LGLPSGMDEELTFDEFVYGSGMSGKHEEIELKSDRLIEMSKQYTSTEVTDRPRVGMFSERDEYEVRVGNHSACRLGVGVTADEMCDDENLTLSI